MHDRSSPLFSIRSLLAATVVWLCVLPVCAQEKPILEPPTTSAAASTNDEGPAGIVPYVKGPNVSIGTTSQHDSSNGWSSLLTPNLAWRFDRHFSADVGAPFFVYANVLVNAGNSLRPNYIQETRNYAAGDTTLSGHFEVHPPLLSYNVTLSAGLPSGKTEYGIGAGKLTYIFNNHFEKDFDLFSPDIEVGISDSSALVDERVRRAYTTVGTLIHFQAGFSVDMPFHATFEVDAYEELPVATQILYSTTGKGKKKVMTATTIGASEDNGFTNALDIPLNGHVTLSGFYNRSLRSHDDTAGFSLTFLLKPRPQVLVH